MKAFLILTAFYALSSAKMCLKLLKNVDEYHPVKEIPGRIWMWNRRAGILDKLESYEQNETAVCTVDEVTELRDKTLVAAAATMPPYIIMNNTESTVSGYLGEVWTILEETMKFKTVYRKVNRSRKLQLQLRNDDTHAILMPNIMYAYPSSLYSYSAPVETNSYMLFVKSDGTSVSKWWYARIFSRGLWLTSILFVIFLTIAIYAAYVMKKSMLDNYTECDNELSQPSFNLLYVLGGISGQGFQKLPLSWSLRLFGLSYLIMGMLLSCGFSSTLTSFLAFRSTSVPITSLEDIVQKKTHSLCLRKDGGAYIHFTVDGGIKGDVLPKWEDIVNRNCPDMKNISAISSTMCQSGFVYMESPYIFISLYKKIQPHCRIYQIPGKHWSLQLAFLHSRSSIYRSAINKLLLKFRSAGILKYLEKKWMASEIENTADQWNDFQPVEYAHVHIMSMGLFTMALVSTFICVLENIWYRFHKRLKKRDAKSVIPRNNKQKIFIRSKPYKQIVARSQRTAKLLWLSARIKRRLSQIERAT
ncbi:probable glutamate receptor [Prorops nasuta]|uniref:probable glutamate receptor n=1 Tax=Prorops nasuta TaxID=863751 RepID=UPI0034CD7146